MANKAKAARPINRNGYWHLVRRVPKRLTELDGRGTVTDQSLAHARDVILGVVRIGK